jgi:hypothetical protein
LEGRREDLAPDKPPLPPDAPTAKISAKCEVLNENIAKFLAGEPVTAEQVVPAN